MSAPAIIQIEQPAGCYIITYFKLKVVSVNILRGPSGASSLLYGLCCGTGPMHLKPPVHLKTELRMNDVVCGKRQIAPATVDASRFSPTSSA
jgi:hypothetical protein